MSIYEQRRVAGLAEVRKLRPYLRIHGLVHDGKWLVHSTCKLCGLKSKKSVAQLKTFDCSCKRASNISASSRMTAEALAKLLRNVKVELLEPYQTMNTRSLMRCLVCKHEWEGFVGNLRSGHACQHCGFIKRERTMLKRYGAAHPSQVPEIAEKRRKTMLRRYGVEHALQNKILFERNLDTSFAWKPYRLGRRLVQVQGYEPQALDWLLTKLKPHQIVCGRGSRVPTVPFRYRGREHIYYPDIWVPHLNRIVEVKSEYTLRSSLALNLRKQKAVLEAGFDFLFIVMDKNGNRISRKRVAEICGEADDKKVLGGGSKGVRSPGRRCS